MPRGLSAAHHSSRGRPVEASPADCPDHGSPHALTGPADMAGTCAKNLRRVDLRDPCPCADDAHVALGNDLIFTPNAKRRKGRRACPFGRSVGHFFGAIRSDYGQGVRADTPLQPASNFLDRHFHPSEPWCNFPQWHFEDPEPWCEKLHRGFGHSQRGCAFLEDGSGDWERPSHFS